MRTIDFFAGALCAIAMSSAAQSTFLCAGYEPPRARPEAAAKLLTREDVPLSPRGQVKVLVVFAQFKDEAPVEVPDYAPEIFDPDLPGSFTHFYTTMSFGQLDVQGTVLARRYVSDQLSSAYLAPNSTEYGQYGEFILEILKKVDADIDLGLFDNNGPAHYYDRNLPAEGLLVWHVRAGRSDNTQEEWKLVDLVCADGQYRDAGFPLRVYNALGQVVRTLVDGPEEQGGQAVVWDGRDEAGQEVGSGVYFYRLEVSGQFAAVRQMALVR